ncbi:MAG: UDP-3-O-(3-hydroxymyristoyl)glucosamine N-acyltransferase [Desulfovibrionaceae bacterium]|nr:UDP-3-O-(3-hydroxymyristoyl)glucosamine N-acyltransferase [Desulfovibrionaceae bacterium]
MPEFQLRFIAQELGLVLQGDDVSIRGMNTLEEAGPHELSFLANPKYTPQLAETKAAAVILTPKHAGKVRRALISANPYHDFARALALFTRREGTFAGVSPLAFVHPEALLGDGCTLYPFAYVGARAILGAGCTLYPGVYVGEDCRLGDGCTLYPNVTLMSAVELGRECVLHAGAVLGTDGFGFTRMGDGIQKIPQNGFVRLGDRVEIGANSAVDRGALGPTCIGDDSKLDNLIQVGHNVRLGKRNLIVAQVGIAGSSSSGDDVTIAGQAAVSGHLRIGARAVIGPRAGVPHDVPEDFKGGGTPLMDGQTFLRVLALTPKLPDLHKTVKKLEQDVDKLKSGPASQE